MHLTLREMTPSIANARTLSIWLAATLVCTMSGPFGTLEMALPLRAFYWAFAIGLAIVMSNVIIRLAFSRATFLPWFLRGVFGALVFSVIYAGILSTFGKLALDTRGTFPGFGLMLIYVVPTAIAITIIVSLFIEMDERREAEPTIGPARFLKRLKPTLGTRLIRLSMQDHYVEAVTDKGNQLILMRFADALDELDGIEGWRIHRSHWVAEAGLAALKRDGGKAMIITTDGAELPVSRTYMPVLREEGVIKRLS